MLLVEKNIQKGDDNSNSSNSENEFKELDDEIGKVIRGETPFKEEKINDIIDENSNQKNKKSSKFQENKTNNSNLNRKKGLDQTKMLNYLYQNQQGNILDLEEYKKQLIIALINGENKQFNNINGYNISNINALNIFNNLNNSSKNNFNSTINNNIILNNQINKNQINSINHNDINNLYLNELISLYEKNFNFCNNINYTNINNFFINKNNCIYNNVNNTCMNNNALNIDSNYLLNFNQQNNLNKNTSNNTFNIITSLYNNFNNNYINNMNLNNSSFPINNIKQNSMYKQFNGECQNNLEINNSLNRINNQTQIDLSFLNINNINIQNQIRMNNDTLNNNQNLDLFTLNKNFNKNIKINDNEKESNNKNKIKAKKSHNQKGEIEAINKNAINLMEVFLCKDKRTTLMIKNIPNKYTISSFLEEINTYFKHTYDIFYLPIDYVNKCNLGFAFINFVEPFHIILFYELYRGKKWKKFNSDKICELLYAKFQGKKELVAHFEKGKVLSMDSEEKRPLILPTPNPLPKINLPYYYLDLFMKIYPNVPFEIKECKNKKNNNNGKNTCFSSLLPFISFKGNCFKN